MASELQPAGQLRWTVPRPIPSVVFIPMSFRWPERKPSSAFTAWLPVALNDGELYQCTQTSVHTGLSNSSSPSTLYFCGGRISGCDSNSPCPKTPALPRSLPSYDLSHQIRRRCWGRWERGRDGHSRDSCLGSFSITSREWGIDVALPTYLQVAKTYCF